MERTLRAIFQQHFEAYAASHRLPLHVHRAAFWLSQCRTAALGGHVRRCPAGHVERAWYNSCHQRICPQCQGIEIERWLDAQKARLLACAHHHLIFTIPHELLELWRYNRAAMGAELMRVVRDCLMEFLGDERYLGAVPGLIVALHTWGRSLSLHPHIHVLATDGGLDEQGQWRLPRRSHFLPARALMALFRGKLLHALKCRLEQRALRLPPAQSAERIRSLFNRLGRAKWNVRLCRRYDHGLGVATYLARYLRGGPLKNAQLLEVSDRRIAFRYRPHEHETGDSAATMMMYLSPPAFLARYLEHLPPPRQPQHRAYGLYAPSQCQKKLARAREHLGQPVLSIPKPIGCEQFLSRFRSAPELTCPKCGSILVFALTLSPATGPPATLH